MCECYEYDYNIYYIIMTTFNSNPPPPPRPQKLLNGVLLNTFRGRAYYSIELSRALIARTPQNDVRLLSRIITLWCTYRPSCAEWNFHIWKNLLFLRCNLLWKSVASCVFFLQCSLLSFPHEAAKKAFHCLR